MAGFDASTDKITAANAASLTAGQVQARIDFLTNSIRDLGPDTILLGATGTESYDDIRKRGIRNELTAELNQLKSYEARIKLSVLQEQRAKLLVLKEELDQEDQKSDAVAEQEKKLKSQLEQLEQDISLHQVTSDLTTAEDWHILPATTSEITPEEESIIKPILERYFEEQAQLPPTQIHDQILIYDEAKALLLEYAREARVGVVSGDLTYGEAKGLLSEYAEKQKIANGELTYEERKALLSEYAEKARIANGGITDAKPIVATQTATEVNVKVNNERIRRPLISRAIDILTRVNLINNRWSDEKVQQQNLDNYRYRFQIKRLLDRTIDKFTAKQMSQINPTILRKWPAKKIAAINPDAVTGWRAGHIATMRDKQISQLTEYQIPKLSVDAIKGFSATRIKNFLEKAQFFIAPQLNSMAEKQIQAIATTALTQMPLATLSQLNLNTIPKLIPSQLNAMAANVNGFKFSDLQINSITPTQAKGLTADTLNSMEKGIAYLKVAAVAVIPVSELNNTNLKNFQPSQKAGMTPKQFNGLNGVKLQELGDLSMLKKNSIKRLKSNTLIHMMENKVNIGEIGGSPIMISQLESIDKQLSAVSGKAMRALNKKSHTDANALAASDTIKAAKERAYKSSIRYKALSAAELGMRTAAKATSAIVSNAARTATAVSKEALRKTQQARAGGQNIRMKVVNIAEKFKAARTTFPNMQPVQAQRALKFLGEKFSQNANATMEHIAKKGIDARFFIKNSPQTAAAAVERAQQMASYLQANLKISAAKAAQLTGFMQKIPSLNKMDPAKAVAVIRQAMTNNMPINSLKSFKDSIKSQILNNGFTSAKSMAIATKNAAVAAAEEVARAARARFARSSNEVSPRTNDQYQPSKKPGMRPS